MRAHFGRVLALVLIPGVVSAATYTVTSSGDAATGGTLRWAILSAATNAGADTIQFNSGYTISPTGTLPDVVDRTTVDGTTFAGFPGTRVTLNGLGAVTHGLVLAGRSNAVEGLRVTRFVDSGINVYTAEYCRVEGCLVLSNVNEGVELEYSANNVIGGTNEAQRNVISGNGGSGVYLWRDATTNNVVCGNYIGVSTNGRAAMSNTYYGVDIYGAVRNTVGGTNAGARNVLSGNFSGVRISKPAHHNVVAGNFIGTDADGSNAVPNSYGVELGTSNNTVGSTSAGGRNVISGNEYDGIALYDAESWSNTVLGNYIGTDAGGSRACSNGANGVSLSDNSSLNTIGGTAAGAGNVIAGNGAVGVLVDATCRKNLIQGNLIGLNAAGIAGISNGLYGIRLYGPSNTVGGTTAGARNVIGASVYGILIQGSNAYRNVVQGNYIGTDATGSNAVPNDTGISIDAGRNNVIGGTAAAARNIISGNTSFGLRLSAGAEGAPTGTVVYGNYIGPDASGVRRIGNGGGVGITDGPGNSIGGTNTGARNVISGNVGSGIGINQTNSTGNRVEGNYIGVDATGLMLMSNGNYGVDLFAARYCTVGGTNPGSRNVIAGHGIAAVRLWSSNALGNQVIGNYIGTDATGSNAMTYGTGYGVMLWEAWSNAIGGGEANAGNLISGNGSHAIYGTGADGNTIQGNLIGPDASESAAIGNAGYGIDLCDSDRNLIGGRTNGEENVIVGNPSWGIRIEGSNSTRNVIQGNWIGCSRATNAMANGEGGIWLSDSCRSNFVGGVFANCGNVIAFNAGQGVYVAYENARGNAVLGNSIFGNTRLGIDLHPVNANHNDAGDGDAGANGLQNFAELISASNNGTNIRIVGSLNSAASRSYRVELFGSLGCDVSGHGEGEVYLGAVTGLVTDASGDAGFTNTVAAPNPPPNFLTATAGDELTGDSSEFSAFILLDSDGDGMGDGYEDVHFGGYTNGQPNYDPDKDGMTHLQEFLADTDPGDGNSFLRITAFQQVNGTQTVTATASPDRMYKLYAVEAVTNDTSAWFFRTLGDSGGGSSITFKDHLATSTAVFRIDAEIP